jgi:hypothetical protein
MNLLAFRLVELALDLGSTQIDLGTSTTVTADGSLRPNSGLIQFKQSVLATAHLRPVLVR